jgi:hypothetical protein
MSKKLHIALWASFAIVSLLTWIVYFRLSAKDFYLVLLFVLAAVNFCQALWILIANRFAWHIVGLVTLAFLIGQWWLFVWSAVFISWRIQGFAP